MDSFLKYLNYICAFASSLLWELFIKILVLKFIEIIPFKLIWYKSYHISKRNYFSTLKKWLKLLILNFSFYTVSLKFSTADFLSFTTGYSCRWTFLEAVYSMSLERKWKTPNEKLAELKPSTLLPIWCIKLSSHQLSLSWAAQKASVL